MNVNCLGVTALDIWVSICYAFYTLYIFFVLLFFMVNKSCVYLSVRGMCSMLVRPSTCDSRLVIMQTSDLPHATVLPAGRPDL